MFFNYLFITSLLKASRLNYLIITDIYSQIDADLSIDETLLDYRKNQTNSGEINLNENLRKYYEHYKAYFFKIRDIMDQNDLRNLAVKGDQLCRNFIGQANVSDIFIYSTFQSLTINDFPPIHKELILFIKKFHDTAILQLYNLKNYFNLFLKISTEFIDFNKNIYAYNEQRYHKFVETLNSKYLKNSNNRIKNLIKKLTLGEFNELSEEYSKTCDYIKSILGIFNKNVGLYSCQEPVFLDNIKIDFSNVKLLFFEKIITFSSQDKIKHSIFNSLLFDNGNGFFEHLLCFQEALRIKVDTDDNYNKNLEKRTSISNYFTNYGELKRTRFFNLIYSIGLFFDLILNYISYLNYSLRYTSLFLKDIFVTKYGSGNRVIRIFKSQICYTTHFNSLIKNHQSIFLKLTNFCFKDIIDACTNYFNDELEKDFSIFNNFREIVLTSLYDENKTTKDVFDHNDSLLNKLSISLNTEWEYSKYNINCEESVIDRLINNNIVNMNKFENIFQENQPCHSNFGMDFS